LAKKVLSSTAKSSSPKSASKTKLGVAKPKPSSRGGLRVQPQQYVGIDLHRRRSVIVRMNDAGEVEEVSKIDNDPVALSMVVAEAGPNPEVALEACYGWVRHEAPHDRVGGRSPPSACRSRSLKLEAA
jgi:hypothetical protein